MLHGYCKADWEDLSIGGLQVSSITKKRLLRLILQVARRKEFWWLAGMATELAIGVFFSWLYWDDLRGNQESLSTTIRNLALVIGGVIATTLAVWRSKVAERQANTAQRGLLNERYQKGAEMLGSKVLAVRLGGVYALERLARDHPEQYHIQIMRLFCAFVRHPTKDKSDISQRTGVVVTGTPSPRFVREDVRVIVQLIGKRAETRVELERKAGFLLDLREVDLSIASLMDANLSDALLYGANLYYAQCFGADLSGAVLTNANLSGTKFSDSGKHPSTGLTQPQLDKARAHPGCPPDLRGVIDVETGKPLVWSGKTLREDE